MTQDDLDGMDVAWMAVDALGSVAIFTTGGVRPVPSTAVASIDITEPEVDSLPEISSFDLLVNLPRPDDFVSFAKRGFFAYDWSTSIEQHSVISTATSCKRGRCVR